MLREWRFVLLAAGAHALFAVGVVVPVALHWVGNNTSLVARSSHRRDVIEIDVPEPLALPAVRVPPPPSPDQPEPTDEQRAERDEPRNAARGDRPPGEPGQVEPVPNGPAAPNGPSREEYDPLPPSGVLTAPGVGGPPVWAMPGGMPDQGPPAPAPTSTPRAREIDKDIAGKVIREAMHEKDKSKGIELPAAGTAASAVQASLYGSDLPTEARGTIAIQIGPGGNVTGVKVVSMVGGNADQWERAAQAAAARLRTQHLDLPEEYKKGAIVYLDAVSMEQLPAGKGSGISGNTAKFDLSNIGAKKRQVVRVSTRVVAIR